MNSLTTLTQIVARLGPLGAADLVVRKLQKRAGYKRMIRNVPKTGWSATLKTASVIDLPQISSREREAILAKADAMLRDENAFFSFPYTTQGIERPWEFDPLEHKHWPQRHYTEQRLHAPDTPADVKIVWEINRFKDLPTLGQAAILTNEKKYADEVERRILSWIEENPFARSINWASALEISIRLVAWTTTLELLRSAGFDVSTNPKIARSIYKQATYLAFDLSTDKVVPTNHLIGEVAGLFLVSALWNIPSGAKYMDRARDILEREILRQTYADGATREASSWYHQFVTHFFDLVDRISSRSGRPMSDGFLERLGKMKTYLAAQTYRDELVRFGDSDDGWAIWLEGDMEAWKSPLFGRAITAAAEVNGLFQTSKHVASHVGESFLFMRAGEFGMGGSGYSSHAHDDFLSPILFLNGLPVLTDPGTYVYNGDKEGRAKYRPAESHNGLIVNSSPRPVQRMNFGWHSIRPDASIRTEGDSNHVVVTGQYGESPSHTRRVELHSDGATLSDIFSQSVHGPCEWRLHLHPTWKIESAMTTDQFLFSNSTGDRLRVVLSEGRDDKAVEPYDFSPSYRVQESGMMIRLTKANPQGTVEIAFTVDRASAE